MVVAILSGCAASTTRPPVAPAPATARCPTPAEPAAPPAPPAKTAADFGLTAYDEGAAATLDASLIEIEPLRDEPIAAGFDNLDDLAWLEAAAKQKVVLLGENHWYRSTHLLATRILFALEQHAHFGLITVELPYSEGGFYDHYVGLADDADAKAFYDAAVASRIGNAETRELLDAVRAWNLAHPKRRIHVRAHDVEHDRRAAVTDVIVPYFEGLDVGFALTAAGFDADPLGWIDALAPWLKRARKARHVGAYPFLTADFVAGVIANLRARQLGDGEDFTYYRQRQIVRNLTDRAYLGDFFRKGKVMLYGGAYHTDTTEPLPDGGSFLREGVYLEHEFAPTRGKVYAIQVIALAYSLGEMAGAELERLQGMGDGLHDKLARMLDAHRAGAITADAAYLTEPPDVATAMLSGLAGTVGHEPFRITKIDWDQLGPMLEQLGGASMRRTVQRQASSHDALIVIPRSPIQIVLPRP